MAELDGVAYADCLGCVVYDLVTLEVGEGQAVAEPVTGTEVP